MSVNSEHESRPWRVADRLSEDDLQSLIKRYHNGVTRRELAEEFKIGMTTLKRLLREHHARLGNRRTA